MLVLASISETVVNDVSRLIRDGGLPAIFALMALSSACIPIPSEVVMLFAGFAVADPSQSGAQHSLTLTGVIVAGVAGCMVGSWVAYAVGRGGRVELFERHGAKFHVGPAQIERADRFFARYGDATVCIGRLIPFVRAFVSLPAGMARMPVARFSILTLIGSIPWVVALTIAGYEVGGDWTSIRKGFEYVDYVIVVAIVVGIVYAIVRRRRGRRELATAGPAAPLQATPAPAAAPETVAKQSDLVG